jgi:hypothetical protein
MGVHRQKKNHTGLFCFSLRDHAPRLIKRIKSKTKVVKFAKTGPGDARYAKTCP